MKAYFLNILKFIYHRFYRRYVSVKWQWRFISWISSSCLTGKGCYIHPSVHMTGAEKISIGSNTSIGEHTWLNVNKKQDGEYAITIGDNCFIGRRNFFTSGSKIVIRDYALTAIDCKFICANHVSDNPLLPYIASGVSYADSIYVGVNCFFGAGATVLGNISIGHGSVIGANCLVTKDIPPFSVVVGSPARVLRRYSFSNQSWINADQITEADLLENPDEISYLAKLKESHPSIFLPLPAAGRNFGNI